MEKVVDQKLQNLQLYVLTLKESIDTSKNTHQPNKIAYISKIQKILDLLKNKDKKVNFEMLEKLETILHKIEKGIFADIPNKKRIIDQTLSKIATKKEMVERQLKQIDIHLTLDSRPASYMDSRHSPDERKRSDGKDIKIKKQSDRHRDSRSPSRCDKNRNKYDDRDDREYHDRRDSRDNRHDRKVHRDGRRDDNYNDRHAYYHHKKTKNSTNKQRNINNSNSSEKTEKSYNDESCGSTDEDISAMNELNELKAMRVRLQDDIQKHKKRVYDPKTSESLWSKENKSKIASNDQRLISEESNLVNLKRKPENPNTCEKNKSEMNNPQMRTKKAEKSFYIESEYQAFVTSINESPVSPMDIDSVKTPSTPIKKTPNDNSTLSKSVISKEMLDALPPDGDLIYEKVKAAISTITSKSRAVSPTAALAVETVLNKQKPIKPFQSKLENDSFQSISDNQDSISSAYVYNHKPIQCTNEKIPAEPRNIVRVAPRCWNEIKNTEISTPITLPICNAFNIPSVSNNDPRLRNRDPRMSIEGSLPLPQAVLHNHQDKFPPTATSSNFNVSHESTQAPIRFTYQNTHHTPKSPQYGHSTNGQIGMSPNSFTSPNLFAPPSACAFPSNQFHPYSNIHGQSNISDMNPRNNFPINSSSGPNLRIPLKNTKAEHQNYAQLRRSKQKNAKSWFEHGKQSDNTPKTYGEYRRRKQLDSRVSSEKLVAESSNLTDNLIEFRNGNHGATLPQLSRDKFNISKNGKASAIVAPTKVDVEEKMDQTDYNSRDPRKRPPRKEDISNVNNSIEDVEENWDEPEMEIVTRNDVNDERNSYKWESNEEAVLKESERTKVFSKPLEKIVSDNKDKSPEVASTPTVPSKQIDEKIVKPEKFKNEEGIKEWLEGYLYNMLNPANFGKDNLLSMLGKVLDEKKFNQIKEIVDGDGNGDKSTGKPEEGVTCPIKTKEKLNKTKNTEGKTYLEEDTVLDVNCDEVSSTTKKCTVKPKRKNELEKLNEDIRTMFICNGVLTATGRRGCTMIKENESPSVKEISTVKLSEKSTIELDSIDQENTSENVEPKVLPLRLLRRRDTICEFEIVSNTNEVRLQDKRKKRKFVDEYVHCEETDNDDELLRPIGSVPFNEPQTKSKTKRPKRSMEQFADKQHSAVTFPSKALPKEIDINAKQIRIVLNRIDITEQSKNTIKIENQDNVEHSTDTATDRATKLEIENCSDKTMKNTNIKSHCLNRKYFEKCMICKTQFARCHAITHYVRTHKNHEVFLSRLSPNVAEYLRNNLENLPKADQDMDCPKMKITQKCYFCNIEQKKTKYSWKMHYGSHTGEYQYHCTSCDTYMQANKHTCKRDKPNVERNRVCSQDLKLFIACICNICNFVQFNENRVINHVKTQHGEKNVNGKYIKVNFLDYKWKKKIRKHKKSKTVVKNKNLTDTVAKLDNSLNGSSEIEMHVPEKPHPKDISSLKQSSMVDDNLDDNIPPSKSNDDALINNDTLDKRFKSAQADGEEEEQEKSDLNNFDSAVYVTPSGDELPPELDLIPIVLKKPDEEDDNNNEHEDNSEIHSKELQTYPETTLSNVLGTSLNLKCWTKNPTLKNQHACEKMLRDITLFALFKCMAVDCFFSTGDADVMLSHIRNHEKYTETQMANMNIPDLDMSSWLECAYCEEVADSCNLLVKHIQDEHSSCIFQCPYCFYRAAAACSVLVHLKQFHTNEGPLVFVCNGKPKLMSDEFSGVLKSRTENVRALNCGKSCNLSFYIIKFFVDHLANHPSHKKMFTCQFCDLEILRTTATNHMLCHGIGLFECVYCLYGTNSVEKIRTHMSNVHPSKLLYVCIRMMRKDKDLSQLDPDSIESTVLTQVGHPVDKNVLHRCPYSDQQLNFMSPSLVTKSINTIDSTISLSMPKKNTLQENAQDFEIVDVKSIASESFASNN